MVCLLDRTIRATWLHMATDKVKGTGIYNSTPGMLGGVDSNEDENGGHEGAGDGDVSMRRSPAVALTVESRVATRSKDVMAVLAGEVAVAVSGGSGEWWQR
eukprot:CAMPEP_0119340772 /NCGR_PEP_ID=MMETSP1333-20130426/101003_1 /TAXON_ID=418940 /ORGANISM="Scyphosphaera apsteinii, Strain RCC1455" /LENGTH=100 /DNA_ID=CAMNT_0007352593 /DNA_START=24 /DNA_END=327 /DNA_ORIENTATION=+